MKAKNSDNEITLIGIDRMNSIHIPHRTEVPKSWMVLNRLRYEIIGCYDSNNEKKQIWHCLDVFDHDADVSISIIYRKLKDLRESGELNSTLIIHLDNCGRENKNRWVFAFCALVIAQKWVKEILLYFLPVGHTHAECDAMFIPFGKSKCIHNIGSPAAIQEWIDNTYKNHNEKPIIKELKFV